MHFEESESDASESENCEIPSLDGIENNCTWAVLSCDNCPNIRDENIINYFIYNKNPVSGKSNRCHRQLKKSKKCCSEKVLSDIYVTQVNDSPYCFVKAKCRPSMKQHVLVHGNISVSQYTLHIVLTKETGSMQFGSCNCKAGLSGVCSHVGGLLFTVVKIKNPCTSRECEWQRPRTISNPPSPKRLRH